MRSWVLKFVLCLMAAVGAASALCQDVDECHGQRENCGAAGSIRRTDAQEARPADLSPPPSIADITAILDSEKPDLATLAHWRTAASLEPADNLTQEELAKFYYARSEAKGMLGRASEALSDGQKAFGAAERAGNARLWMRIGMLNTGWVRSAGDLKAGLATLERMMAEADKPETRGNLFPLHHTATKFATELGDMQKAEVYLREGRALIEEARRAGPRWRSYPIRGASWETSVAFMEAIVFAASGHFQQAEVAYIRARDLRIKSIEIFKNPKMAYDRPLIPEQERQADLYLLYAADMKARQGRLAEAELDARTTLLSRLKADGKYNPTTIQYVTGLADILNREGRFSDAEKLARAAVDIQHTVGMSDDQVYSAAAISSLALVLVNEGKSEEANELFDQLDHATAKWETPQRDKFLSNVPRIQALLASNRNEEALVVARSLVQREIARVGEDHYDSASARGFLAIALMRSGRTEEAIHEFEAALPILRLETQQIADDGAGVIAAPEIRLRFIAENYIKLLAATPTGTDEAAEHAFAAAESARGRAVQKALAEYGARVAANDPDLAGLARRGQDLGKQIRTQFGLLNNFLSVPSDQRDKKILHDTEDSITRLRADLEAASTELNERFPTYADLVNPKPPTLDQVRGDLREGESALSFYFGDDVSFVWAIPKRGKVAFARIDATPADIKARIRKLREALDPEVALISDLPPFDVGLAYQLYALLLKPVESGWKQSRSLIVVTNGPLGLLPLSLLPTQPSILPEDDGELFASYRKVPWLARTHNVTTLPSLSALRTVRSLPMGASDRSQLIAFGDPLFSEQEAAEAAEESTSTSKIVATTRGVPLKRRSSPNLNGADSAELAMLPRLADTADELQAIALALRVNPATTLRLGKDANETVVKTTDLSRFKIVAFATHGLASGELKGLTQPALALTAPIVAGVDGDGLLTMGEILQLKLDADWVILSACNTGAGQGIGSEAASGLGRAFFYAGTRAILLTNWSVHSQSAKELVTGLFQRYADDPALTRAEALRQSMMALMDGPGYLGENGKTEFAYAHPFFWAPYTIIGDGGSH